MIELTRLNDTKLMLNADLIESVAEASIQYIEVADPDTLDIFKDKTGERVQMLMAVRVGGVRLIDNMRL